MREPRASPKLCLLHPFDVKEEFNSVMREQMQMRVAEGFAAINELEFTGT